VVAPAPPHAEDPPASYIARLMRNSAESVEVLSPAWTLACRAAVCDQTLVPGDFDPIMEASRTERSVATLACAHMVVASWGAMNMPLLVDWVGTQRRLAEGADSTGRAIADISRGWLDLAHGRRLRANPDMPRIGWLAVEATVQAALSEFSHGGDAVDLARRATRMARSEEVPGAEILAYIALARARRHQGKPYMAARILDTLIRLGARSLRPLVEWERILSGPGLIPGKSASPAHAALRKVSTSSLSQWMSVVRILEDHAMRWPASRPEVAALCYASAPVECEENEGARWYLEPNAWSKGEEDCVPSAIVGWAGHAPPSEPGDFGPCGVWVLAHPGGTARRCLRSALTRCDVRVCRADALRQLRPLTTLATLALAGTGGLRRETLFKRVFGFAYDSGRHAGVLRTTVSRARRLLERAGRIDRAGAVLSLELNEPFAVPDPRCAPNLDEQILRALGSRGGATTREAAHLLSVPPRTVRRALSRLVSEGVCRQITSGSRVRYELEDTTFSEPTVARFSRSSRD